MRGYTDLRCGRKFYHRNTSLRRIFFTLVSVAAVPPFPLLLFCVFVCYKFAKYFHRHSINGPRVRD